MSPVKLALADDHSLFLEGLGAMFLSDPDIDIHTLASDGQTLLDSMRKSQPDVVLLDITMPDKGGESVAAEILRKYPDVKIIMLSMHQGPEHVLPLVDLGVHGFLQKNASHSELKSAIHLVHQGRKYFSETVLKVIHRRHLKEEKEEVQLTRREREVLQFLYEGLSTQDMADRLFISQFTVFKHRQNLLQKCNCKNANQLVNLGIRKGWIQVKPDTTSGELLSE